MEDSSPIKSFSDLKLNSWLIRQCQTIGVKAPTEIQKAVIPHILNEEDCIGCAQTGSGKTLAFALPILQKWCEDPYGIFALVLTPTRELAYQIGDQFLVLGKSINLRVCIVTGGMDMVLQGRELGTRPHILIATPGRLADHLSSCDSFSLARTRFLVLDEADRLLSGLFDDQMRTIFDAVPPRERRQTLMFSATMTDTLEQVKTITRKQVFVWESKQDLATVEELDQYYVLCPYDIKDGYLVETVRLYREKSPQGAIVIFTDTCRSCQVLTMMLNDIGLQTVGLHGMISQRNRLASLSQFKSNVVKILVATDVASRGLDIAGVELVINYNIPPSPKDYIHRVGRTARAGRYGNAISLVTPYDIDLLKHVEAVVGAKLEEFSVNGKKVSEIYMQVSVTKREAEIRLDETEFNAKKLINKRKKLILAGKSPEEADEIIRKMEEKKAAHLERRKVGGGTGDERVKKKKFPVDEMKRKIKKNNSMIVEKMQFGKVHEPESEKEKKREKTKKRKKSNNEPGKGMGTGNDSDAAGDDRFKVKKVEVHGKNGRKEKMDRLHQQRSTKNISSSDSFVLNSGVKKKKRMRNADLDEIKDLLGI